MRTRCIIAPLAAAATAFILTTAPSRSASASNNQSSVLAASRAAALGDLSALEAIAATNSTNLHFSDHNGWSALHEACRAGHTEIVKFLVQQGADVNERVLGGERPTALGIAQRFLPNNHPVVAYLVSVGAKDVGFEGNAASTASVAVGVDGSVDQSGGAFSSSCANKHARCEEWAGLGECENNPKYMLTHCEESCEVCDLPCIDTHERCGIWAERDECNANPKYMLKNCRQSCQVCGQSRRQAYSRCVDSHEKCEEWADKDECDKNPGWMVPNCAKSCWECVPEVLDLGEDQVIPSANSDLFEETRKIVLGTDTYVLDEVFANPNYDRHVRKECKNRHEKCSFWAAEGECNANPKYMKLNCALACRTCEILDFKHRCPIPENATDAFGPGGLNAMFERIADEDELSKENGLNVTVLARPGRNVDEGGVERPSDDSNDLPWVVTMENFVSPEECEHLIELGGLKGYERSQDVGKRRFDGTYEGYQNERRTSKNAWCNDECYEDPVTMRVVNRIEAVTGVPKENSEYLQLLRYEEGQFYRTHHDYIGHHVGRPIGPRVLTIYLYLNDVEEGGGTNFPDLGITVMPKRGMALLWPSVLDEDPNAKDFRTDHQALPVERGVKYGANGWLHLRDYKGPDSAGCA